MNSPVNYYGGKTYMTETIVSMFPQSYKRYIEGFGGGASVLLNKPITPLEVYNDLEQNIYSLFKVISNKESLDRLKNRLYLTPYSSQLREEYKELLTHDDLSIEDRAYYFFYVCRTSFNGIGEFSYDTNLVRRGCTKCISSYLGAVDGLSNIYQRLCNAMIFNMDIFDLIDKFDFEDTFFYLDPPYVQSTRKSNNRYKEEFEDDLHVKLVDRLLKIKGKCLISGYDSHIYDKLVENGWHKYTFKAPNVGYEATEVLWYNYETNIIKQESLWEE